MKLGNWWLGLEDSDSSCGLFSFWLDNLQSWSMTAHFFVKPRCWGWGFRQDDLLSRQRWFGLGPLFLISWGAT